MKRLVLIDVSHFIFRAFYAVPPLHAPDGTPVNALHGLAGMLIKLLSSQRPTHLLAAIDTEKGSFRNDLDARYKANRPPPPDDLVPQFALATKLIRHMKIPLVFNERYEADDLIGSACTQWKHHFDEILMATGDKDFMQLVTPKVKMLDTMKDRLYGEKDVLEKMGVAPSQIVDYLAIVGDSSDNVPGLKGVGPKGAVKLLAEYGDFDQCVQARNSFQKKSLRKAFTEGLDDALLSKKLVAIVTDVDLGLSPKETAYIFSLNENLKAFLETLGLKNILQRLENLYGEGGDLPSKKKIPSRMVAREDLPSLIPEIKAAKTLTMTVQFEGEGPVHQKIEALSFSFDKKDLYTLDKDLHRFLCEVWGDEKLEVVSDQWKRLMAYAQEHHIEVRCTPFDIPLAHYLVDPDGQHTLAAITQKYFQEALEEGPSGAGRTLVLSKLGPLLKKELEESALKNIYENLEVPLLPILARMEQKGMVLDLKVFAELEKEWVGELETLEREILAYNKGAPLNLNSPKQVSVFLFDTLKMPVIKRTKTGLSTDSDVLETLERETSHPVPRSMLRYREFGKLLSTYVRALPTLVHRETNRLHTSFDQTGAATGRLSSSHPNLQNIPTRTELGRKIRRGSWPCRGIDSSPPIIPKSNCASWRTFPRILSCSRPSRRASISTNKRPVKSSPFPSTK